ncbi:MAG: response regulator transcription factor [Rhodospirillaceae bacterium]|nr:response regulator transcription factor [Rhodospirillaceae bacterium]
MRPLKRILVADDHALFRKGLKLLLSDVHPKADLRDVDSLDSALECLSGEPVDLAILDLRMPGMNGPESLRAVREAYPDTMLLVLSGSDARNDVLGALGAGVHGYVVKTSPDAELLAAIERVRKGQVYVPPQLAAPAADAPAAEPDAPVFEGLTPRQRDVLRLLARGKANKEIARELDLAEGTVKIHLAAVLRFLKARNRTEAAVLAARYKL